MREFSWALLFVNQEATCLSENDEGNNGRQYLNENFELQLRNMGARDKCRQKDYLAVLKITGDEKSSIYSDFDSENCF